MLSTYARIVRLFVLKMSCVFLLCRSVPGDANYEVRGGPSFIHFPIAKSRNIFLPRAAKKGMIAQYLCFLQPQMKQLLLTYLVHLGNNFLRRHELLKRKAHLLRDRYDEMDKQNDSRDAASTSNSNNEIINNSSSSGGGDSNVPSPAKKRGRPRKKQTQGGRESVSTFSFVFSSLLILCYVLFVVLSVIVIVLSSSASSSCCFTLQ